MEPENTKEPRRFGFISPDGYFQDIRFLTSGDLEYVSKSLEELHLMLTENLTLERYEKCASIRDEINKRLRSSK